VFGQSLGGQFVIDTAFRDPDLFYGLIASNPALHRNLAHFTRPDDVQQAAERTPKLLVSSALEDSPQFREPAEQWIAFWTRRDLPLELKVIEPASHNHFSPAPLAFRQGLRWILSE
jgi:predicted alpha/beta superfamily hydrolase